VHEKSCSSEFSNVFSSFLTQNIMHPNDALLLGFIFNQFIQIWFSRCCCKFKVIIVQKCFLSSKCLMIFMVHSYLWVFINLLHAWLGVFAKKMSFHALDFNASYSMIIYSLLHM
jgi:hypothetical protein